MKKYFSFLGIAILLFSFSSCKKEGYKAPVSNTVEMSGRWLVQFWQDIDGNGEVNEEDDGLIYSYEDIGEVGLVTSNVASNSKDTILVNVLEDIWELRIKAPVDLKNLAMRSVDGLPNILNDEEGIRVVKGQILKGAARTRSGAVADSIYFEFESTDDPGNFYVFAGHRDSGQPEDQY